MPDLATPPGGLHVPVALGERSYDIRVESGSDADLESFVRAALDASWAGKSCRSSLIVTDAHVAKLPIVAAWQRTLDALAIGVEVATVPAGEGSKCLDVAATLYDRLIQMKADRHTAIVAIGGGVIGDLAGFVAATYARGLPLLMSPTTLLSQVDSSVGGKTGVNHPGAKNIIGAFHQPVGVWIDTSTLDSLPDRELRCGLAEVVKYGVILDAAFFEALERDAEVVLDRDPAALRAIIARSCQLKAMVVSEDEREQTGLRAVLNFGHTVGHAIEAVAGYSGAFQHGEAVAAGMVAECRLAERIDWIDPSLTDRLIALLERFGLPTGFPGLDPDRMIAAMGRDKKNQAGTIRFVLPRELGRVELTNLVTPALLNDVVTALADGEPR